MTRRILLYSLARLAIFGAALTVLLLVGLDWLWATLAAAVIGLCVSYLALGPLRDAVSQSIWEKRNAPDVDTDAEAEDALSDELGR